jgi:hypothetical protein
MKDSPRCKKCGHKAKQFRIWALTGEVEILCSNSGCGIEK